MDVHSKMPNIGIHFNLYKYSNLQYYLNFVNCNLILAHWIYYDLKKNYVGLGKIEIFSVFF